MLPGYQILRYGNTLETSLPYWPRLAFRPTVLLEQLHRNTQRSHATAPRGPERTGYTVRVLIFVLGSCWAWAGVQTRVDLTSPVRAFSQGGGAGRAAQPLCAEQSRVDGNSINSWRIVDTQLTSRARYLSQRRCELSTVLLITYYQVFFNHMCVKIRNLRN